MNPRETKPALGRGLGDLLDGVGVAGRPASPDTDAAPVSAGVGSLLRGKAAAPATTRETTTETLPRSVGWLRVSLFTADVLLCGLAAVLVFRKGAPLTAGELGLCAAAVLVGAWLGCEALLLGRPPK